MNKNDLNELDGNNVLAEIQKKTQNFLRKTGRKSGKDALGFLTPFFGYFTHLSVQRFISVKAYSRDRINPAPLLVLVHFQIACCLFSSHVSCFKT